MMKDKILTLLLDLSLCENYDDANQWYENSRLPGCGNKTARELVGSSQGDLVIDYIKHVADGSYA